MSIMSPSDDNDTFCTFCIKQQKEHLLPEPAANGSSCSTEQGNPQNDINALIDTNINATFSDFKGAGKATSVRMGDNCWLTLIIDVDGCWSPLLLLLTVNAGSRRPGVGYRTVINGCCTWVQMIPVDYGQLQAL